MTEAELEQRLRKAHDLGYDQGLKDGRAEGQIEGMSRVLKGVQEAMDGVAVKAYRMTRDPPGTVIRFQRP